MNNSDLTKLANSVPPDPAQLPTIDELAPQVAAGPVPVKGEALAVFETITKELHKDSVSVPQEVAAATKLDPMPDAPVILAPPPASEPPKLSVGGGGASSEASLSGVGPPIFVANSTASGPSKAIPEEQKANPELGSGSPGSIPQTKNLSSPFQTEASSIASLLSEQVGALSDVVAMPEEMGPNRVPEGMSEAQVNFMLAKVLDNVSQDAAFAGNPAASAASRKAFESFVGKILDSEALIKEKHSYFHDLTGLLALIFTASDSHPGGGVSSSEGAVGIAMGFMAKSLKDGSELVALLMGAIMLANTVPYAAANETLQEEKVDPNSLTLEFAKKYAERIIKLTSDPAYSGYLKELVLIHEANATPERLDQFVSVLKIGLLLTAVALLYQAEMGGGTAEEVLGCLRPNQEIKQNDFKTPLLKQIKVYLDLLSTSEREAVLMAMMEYLDSRPDLKSITDPIKVMQGMKMTGAFVPGQIQLASGA